MFDVALTLHPAPYGPVPADPIDTGIDMEPSPERLESRSPAVMTDAPIDRLRDLKPGREGSWGDLRHTWDRD
jgi:hypothetical protein